MKPKLILLLIMLLLFSSGPQILAKPQATNVHQKQKTLQANLEIQFRVEGVRLVALKGNQTACQTDNAFVVAALQGKRLELKGLDYTVNVTKLTTGFIKKDGRDELVIYEYRVVIKEPGRQKILNDLSRQLQGKKSIAGGILPFGNPVTCHYLVYRDQLILVTYYGFPESYEKFNPESWIASHYFRSGRK